jgi:hypothetical protein
MLCSGATTASFHTVCLSFEHLWLGEAVRPALTAPLHKELKTPPHHSRTRPAFLTMDFPASPHQSGQKRGKR